MKHFLLVFSAFIMLTSCQHTPQLGKDSIDEVIDAMTLEEKVRLVIGTGMDGFNAGDSAVVGETHNLVPGAAGTTYPIERLGIPAIVLADGPAGLRINPTREGDDATYYATHFPIATLLASTWDTDLVESVGNAMGNEVLEYGADVLLAPALNIHRNPLNGRNFEYFSEDPLLSGKMAAAYVKGVQNNGVGTSVKHFAANNQETNRMANDARISPRALREIYLKGFEIAVKEAEPWTVMSSYNKINGTYTSENPELLTTILRDEWDYDGVVMTDWFGGKDAVAQMNARNDMLQPGYNAQYEQLMAGLQDGSLSEEQLNKNVKAILELILKSPKMKGYKPGNHPDLASHADVTRRSASEGMVLLKNDNKTLPFNPNVKNIALFGVTSYDFIPGGTGSGNVNRAYTVSMVEGLEKAGYKVDNKLKSIYDNYIPAEKDKIKEEFEKKMGTNSVSFFAMPLPDEINVPATLLPELATYNDVAIITIGRNSGEFYDRSSSDFVLSENTQKLIDEVTKSFHAKGKPVIVVLNVGGVIETQSWKNKPDAILLAWQGGQEGGNSVADILTGKKNPSGKLPMTFPVSLNDHYSSLNFPIDKDYKIDFMNKDSVVNNEKNVDFTNYDEDIYVGYRYFDSFNKPVSYPFGYGLSYTDFEYGVPTLSLEEDVIKIIQPVKNIGKTFGKEVVQLYVSAPETVENNKPEKELKAFAKTRDLKPGEAQELVLTVKTSDLSSYDEDHAAWILDDGTYNFLIGASSRDIKYSLPLMIKGNVLKTNNVLNLKEPINRLVR